jgi:DNA-binding transcriptional MerR regulator
MKNEELEKYEGREDLRLDELLVAANSLMEAVAPVQPSDRVTETLSERTLRYYISQGLVDRPSGKEGVSALYGYRHLLQLLALKRLQASYLPVKKIREIVPESTNDELRAIVLGGGTTETSSLSATSTRDSVIAFLDSISQGRPVARSLQSQGTPTPSSPAPGPQSPSDTAGSSAQPPAAQSWERYVLDDGIELHIRSDRGSSLRKSEARRLFDRMLKIFKR